MGAADLSAFLSWLAEHQEVSASTQNQALSAVLFLYKAVLAIEIGGVPPVVRARTPERLAVVLSRDEVTALPEPLAGTMRLVVTLLYGAGLRLEECLTLRVKDLDFDRHQISALGRDLTSAAMWEIIGLWLLGGSSVFAALFVFLGEMWTFLRTLLS